MKKSIQTVNNKSKLESVNIFIFTYSNGCLVHRFKNYSFGISNSDLIFYHATIEDIKTKLSKLGSDMISINIFDRTKFEYNP